MSAKWSNSTTTLLGGDMTTSDLLSIIFLLPLILTITLWINLYMLRTIYFEELKDCYKKALIELYEERKC